MFGSTVPSLVEKMDTIFNKDMCTFISRLNTFTDWSPNFRVQPQNLSEAGFYSERCKDRVTCFYCGVCVFNWLPEDDPWIEHTIHSKDCAFLLLNKPKLKTVLMKDAQLSYSRLQYMVIVSFLILLSMFFILCVII